MRILATLLLLALLTPARAQESAPGLRVLERKEPAGVTLSAQALFDLETTVTVQCVLTNATASAPLPVTVDSAGRQAFELLHIAQKDRALPWRYTYTFHWLAGARRNSRANDAIYQLPFRPGEMHRLLQGNLGKFSHFAGSQSEYALDWEAPIGTVVCAAQAGLVTGVRQDFTTAGTEPHFKSEANYVIIKHADGTFAEYLHLQPNGALVHLGEKVTVGQPIARSGHTGFSDRPHLHFSVFQALDGNTRLSLPSKYRTPLGILTTLNQGQSY